MRQPSKLGAISSDESRRLHGLALRRAQVLRRQASDDFWRAAGSAWRAVSAGVLRGAQRLARFAREPVWRR